MRRKHKQTATATDVELIAAVPFDEWAFPEFYRRYFFHLAGWMYRRTNDAEAAHGLANEAMAKAFQYSVKPSRRAVEHPRAWMFTIGRRELAKWRERGELETPTADDIGLTIQTPDERLEAIVEYSDLYAALDQLSDDEALALLMGYGEGHSMAEVAEAIGKSREATKKMMQRAAGRVRDHLDG